MADQREAQAREVAAEAGLPADVRSLLGSRPGAARAPQATFSASFAAGTGTIVVHQAPPRRRVDVVDAGVARESFVTGDDGRTIRCERPEGRGWTCGETDAGSDGPVAGATGFGAFSPELVARTVEALEEGLAAYDVRVEPLTVAGVQARCLRTVPKSGSGGATATSRLCISPDGVPVLVERGAGSPVLRAVAYRSRVDADDLRRPDE